METKTCSKCGEIKESILFETNRLTCKLCRKNYIKSWNLINSDLKKKYDETYQKNNFEKEKIRRKKYFSENKEKIAKYWRDRKKNDPLLRLSFNMRSRLKIFLKLNKISKKNLSFNIIGCSPQFLKDYLEQKFTEGMSWDKIGKDIHIDHIIPLSSAKTEEDVYRLCHYTNLQPLWAYDNLSKSDKIL
jgi:hypothetical protein